MTEHPLLVGLALVLILEGITPFLAPALWRQFLLEMANMSDKKLRTVGGLMLLSGALLFQWAKS